MASEAVTLFRRIEESCGSDELVERIKTFQNYVWNSGNGTGNPCLDELLSEVAYDLDYFEPDEDIRTEDPSYFGLDKLSQILVETRLRLVDEFKI